MDDLFKIDSFLDSPYTESDAGSEFTSSDPAFNPTKDFGDTKAGNPSTATKEPPSEKRLDGGETPSSKPYDQKSIPQSNKVTLTSSVYNQALKDLQKSLKESVDVLATLQNAVIKENTVEGQQESYTESVIDQAVLDSYDNGPIYEAVDRSDKKEIKTIVAKIRSEIKGSLSEEGVTFYKPNQFVRVLSVQGIPAAVAQTYKNHTWQIVGIFHTEGKNAKAIITKLNEDFKEDLGVYKLLSTPTIPSLYDAFKTKFGWKNNKGAYVLVVDKKLPSELKTGATTPAPTGGVKTESGSNCDDNDKDCKDCKGKKDCKEKDSKGKKEKGKEDDDE